MGLKQELMAERFLPGTRLFVEHWISAEWQDERCRGQSMAVSPSPGSSSPDPKLTSSPLQSQEAQEALIILCDSCKEDGNMVYVRGCEQH